MDWPDRLWTLLIEHLQKTAGHAPGCLSTGRTRWTQSFCPAQAFWDSVFPWLQSKDCKGKVTPKNFVIQLKPILHMELSAGRKVGGNFILKIRLRIKTPKKNAMRKSWDNFQWNGNTTSGAWTLILGNTWVRPQLHPWALWRRPSQVARSGLKYSEMRVRSFCAMASSEGKEGAGTAALHNYTFYISTMPKPHHLSKEGNFPGGR